MTGLTPQPNWKQLTPDELAVQLDKSDKKYDEIPKEYYDVDLILLNLVKKGIAKAWLCPDGQIRYQYGGNDKK